MYSKILPEFQEKNLYKGTPLYIYVSLNNICNSNCIFCNVHEEKNKHCIIDIEELLVQMNEIGTRYIHFLGGGEPFLDVHIFDYVKKANEMGMKVAFTTNGYALNEEKIDILKNYNISHIVVSLDGHCASIHDSLRRVSGMWEKVVSNIQYMKREMPKTNIVINHVLNNKNITYLQEMIKLKKVVPYDYLNILLIKDYKKLFFSYEQIKYYNEHFSDYIELAQQEKVEFLYDDINFFGAGNVNDYCNGIYLTNNYKCDFPYYTLYIDCTTGGVYPCDCTVHRDPQLYKCGNLLKSKLRTIWNGERILQVRKFLHESESACKQNCDYVNYYFNQR